MEDVEDQEKELPLGNELCFVWGAPLSGQRHWMLRAAEETESEVRTTLIPYEGSGMGGTLESMLSSLEGLIGDTRPDQIHHIYCELPWEATQDGERIEDWIEAQPQFGGTPVAGKPFWNLSFVGVTTPDADRLPETYRRGLEEFSRASRSAVIIVRVEGDNEDPGWLDTGAIDFGRKIELYDESLWEQSTETEAFQKHTFRDQELQSVVMPVSGERASFSDLFRELAQGQYGSVWGAEAYWRNGHNEFEALTLSQGRIFSWKTDHPSFLKSAPLNGAMLSLVGDKLRETELFQALRCQSFC